MSEETKDINAAEPETEGGEEAAAPKSIKDLERKMKLEGTVERLELYGAFIDVGLDAKALVHISKLGNERVNRVSDAVSIGDEVEVWVDSIDIEQNQIMVSMKEPLAVEWSDLKEGQVYNGEVTRLESYGAFVDIGAEREGLVHISELSHDYVKNPSEVVSVGDDVEVKVIGINRRKRRIDLSIKALLEEPESEAVASKEDVSDFSDEPDEMPTAMEIAMRRAMGKTEGDQNGKKNKKAKGKKKARGQDDILSRTLELKD
jgi:ribosomal protein S1